MRTTIGSISFPGPSAGTSPVSVASPPALGAGPFTVEWWQWVAATAPYSPVVFAFSSTLAVALQSTATLWVAGSSATSVYAPIASTWQHWAVVRSGTAVTLYAQGAPIASLTITAGTNLTGAPLTIGGGGGGGVSGAGGAAYTGSFTGLISEFRVVLGSALYAGAFTPTMQPFDPIAGTALLLHAASAASLLSDASSAGAALSASSGVSWSSAAPFTCWASGSLSFSGSVASVLQVPAAAAQFGSGDWTIELYASAIATSYARLVSIGTCCTNLIAIELSTTTSVLSLMGTNYATSTWTPQWGAWLHHAIVRNGTTISWFVGGRPVVSVLINAASNFSASFANPMLLGGDLTFRAYSGLVSNFRIAVGTAVYPVAFSPLALLPLPAVSGTLLLLTAASSATPFADSSGLGVIVSATGGVTRSASAPPGASGSLSFAGNATSVVTVPASAVQLGSADFTIECWVNAQSQAYSRIFSIGVCCGFSLSIELETSGNSVLVTPAGNTVSPWYAAVFGQWQHHAIVRSGTSLLWFANGVLAAQTTTASTTNFSASAALPFVIGGDTTFRALKGLITQFRVVTGAALYPPAILPPSQPLATTPSTTVLLGAANITQPFADSSAFATGVNATGVSWSALNPFDINGSLSFTGAASSLITVPAAAAQFGTADFTLDWWCYPLSSAVARIVALGACCGFSLSVELETSGTSALVLPTGNIYGTYTAVWGAWAHHVLQRNGSTIAWFVNGMSAAYGAVSSTTNFSATAATPFYVGGDSTFRAYKGLLSFVRVTPGTALYPLLPSMALPVAWVPGTLVQLTAASSTAPFADSSGNGVTATATGVSWSASAPPGASGSLFFSGSASSILSIPAAAVQLGTGNFVVEWWMNAQSQPYSRPVSIGICCSTLLSVELTASGNSVLVLPTGNVGSSWAATWNVWNHHAIVRTGTTIVWLVNGVPVVTRTIANTTNFSPSSTLLYLGGDTTSRVLLGNISNFRVVASSTAFTPPTGMPQAVPGTTLLLGASNGMLPFADTSGNGVAVAATGVAWTPSGPIDPGPCVAAALITCSGTQTLSQTQSSTPSPTQSPSATVTASMSQTQTPSVTQSQTPSGTPTPTLSQSASQTTTASATPTPSTTQTASATATPTSTSTLSQTRSASQTQSPSTTPTPSAALTPSPTQTASLTVSPSQTQSSSAAQTPSLTQTPSATSTSSPTQTTSVTQSPSSSQVPSASASGTATQSASLTASQVTTRTGSMSSTMTPSAALTVSQTSTLGTKSQSASQTQTLSVTLSAPATPSLTQSGSQTRTPTPSCSPTTSQMTTPSPAGTGSPSQTRSASVTGTGSASATASMSQTATETLTVSPSVTSGLTRTATPSQAATPSATPTLSPSGAATRSQTRSLPPTPSPTASPTVTPTASPSQAPSVPPSVTATASPTQTATSSATPTLRPSASSTASASSSQAESPTGSASGTRWGTRSGTQPGTATQTLAAGSATLTGGASSAETLSATASAATGSRSGAAGTLPASSSGSLSASRAPPPASAAASPSASPLPTSSCAAAQLVVVRVAGDGVSPGLLLDPDVGGLLRLSLSCAVGAPLQCVLVVAVNATNSSGAGPGPREDVSPSAAVNLAGGNCSSVRQRRAQRRLAPVAAPCCAVDVTLSISAPAEVSVSTSISQPGALTSFLGAAAAATGAHLSAFTASVVSTPILPVTAPSTPASSSSAAAPGMFVVVGAAVGGAALLCLIAVIVFVALRRRRRGAGRAALSGAAERGGSPDGAAGDVMGRSNPMHAKGGRSQARPPPPAAGSTSRRDVDAARSFKPRLSRRSLLLARGGSGAPPVRDDSARDTKVHRVPLKPLGIGGAVGPRQERGSSLGASRRGAAGAVAVSADGTVALQSNPLHASDRDRGQAARSPASPGASSAPLAAAGTSGSPSHSGASRTVVVADADGSVEMQSNPLGRRVAGQSDGRAYNV